MGQAAGWWTALEGLGLRLPPAPRPLAAYVPARLHGGLIHVSGQLPVEEGALRYRGRVGRDLTVEEGAEAARLCALGALAAAAAAAGRPAGVLGVLSVQGWVQSDPDFHEQARVLNGASEFFRALFGDAGAHVRAAVGAAALPLDAAVEVAVTFVAAD